MSLDDLDAWLRGRAGADPPPLAASLSMLDGFVSAVVAGPVSMDPRHWICPLLGIDPDAFNHGGTPEFAALRAVIVRHNEIGRATLATLWRDIPFSVEAIRKFWMPIRFKTRPSKPPRHKRR